MPIAGAKVAAELEKVCDQEKCVHLTDYFNRLYVFKQEYEIYKRELAK